MNKETLWDRFDKCDAICIVCKSGIKSFFHQEILDMLGRIEIKGKKPGFMERAYKDKDYAFIDGYNSAVRLLKDKIQKEKDNIQ